MVTYTLTEEMDDAACATRRARGHLTLQADVAALDPQEFAPVRLLIGSPPCQAFSMAGKGHARRAMHAYKAAMGKMGMGEPFNRDELDERCEDPRGHLVLEPLRWALALRPRFIALEQVRPVLPLWEAMANVLRANGYGVWTGVLSTERFGVPQTRERAILLARLGGQVSAPAATHRRYVAPRVKATGFPAGYPWQGSRTAQYRQIGDAVPPPFARALLEHLLGGEL